jgi:hypothetical protein
VAYLAFGVGVMQGFLGLGGGIVIVPIMIYWIGCSTRMAVGTSLFVVAVSAIAGSISHALRDNVDLPLVLLVLVSSTLGAYAGAALHHRLKPYQVRFYFSGVLFAALSVIAIRMLFRFGIIS